MFLEQIKNLILGESFSPIKMKGRSKMLCEKCKTKKPTVFFSDSGGLNHSLCAACAALHAENTFEYFSDTSPELLFTPRPSLADRTLLSTRLPIHTSGSGSCRLCKKSLADVGGSGEFGCPECAGLLLSPERTPKMPRRITLASQRKNEILEIRGKLEDCIRREEFESAAKLRDRLRELERAV